MKVAICFWGLCRSTEHTIESLQENLFGCLKAAGIEYTVFLHTFILTRKYNNPRAGERNIFLKTTTWRYIQPNVSKVENQDEVDKTLNLSAYRRYGDPWQSEGIEGYEPYSCLDNSIRSLYSLSKVTDLWLNSGETFDCVLYVRPDVRLLTPFNTEWLSRINNTTIYLPNFHLIDGCNDRFAFGTPAVMKLYGKRFTKAQDYSQEKQLHSEKFLAHFLSRNQISVVYVPFYFRRIRSGGIVYPGDIKITSKGVSIERT